MVKFLILLSALLWMLDAMAYIVYDRQTTTSFAGNGAVTIPTTQSGNLVVVEVTFRSSSTASLISVTDGGDSFVSANARSVSTAMTRAQEIWYCLNISGGKTSLTVTQTGAGTIDVVVYEYHTSLGGWLFDTSSATSEVTTSNTNLPCASLTTLGVNDLIFSTVSSNALTINNSVDAPFTYFGTDTNSAAIAHDLSAGLGTYTPTFHVGSNSTAKGYVCTAAAFTEYSSGAKVFTQAYTPTVDPSNFYNGSSINVTIPSTTAGNLLVVLVNLSSNTATITSITNGGDTFLSANARSIDSIVLNSTEIWYALNISGGKTAITVNISSSLNAAIIVQEYHSRYNPITFDTSSFTATDSMTSGQLIACAPITTTGSNDLIVAATFSEAYYLGSLRSIYAPFNFLNYEHTWENIHIDALDMPPGTYTPSIKNSGSESRYSCSVAAFKSASPVMHRSQVY